MMAHTVKELINQAERFYNQNTFEGNLAAYKKYHALLSHPDLNSSAYNKEYVEYCLFACKVRLGVVPLENIVEDFKRYRDSYEKSQKNKLLILNPALKQSIQEDFEDFGDFVNKLLEPKQSLDYKLLHASFIDTYFPFQVRRSVMQVLDLETISSANRKKTLDAALVSLNDAIGLATAYDWIKVKEGEINTLTTGLNEKLGDYYVRRAEKSEKTDEKIAAYQQAIPHYQEALATCPEKEFSVSKYVEYIPLHLKLLKTWVELYELSPKTEYLENIKHHINKNNLKTNMEGAPEYSQEFTIYLELGEGIKSRKDISKNSDSEAQAKDMVISETGNAHQGSDQRAERKNFKKQIFSMWNESEKEKELFAQQKERRPFKKRPPFEEHKQEQADEQLVKKRGRP